MFVTEKETLRRQEQDKKSSLSLPFLSRGCGGFGRRGGGLGGDRLGGGRGEQRWPPRSVRADCACAGRHLQERSGCGRGQARPIWKTSDFVVVSLSPTTNPSLPHGAGHRSGVWAGPRPPFWLSFQMFFWCFLRVLENTSGSHPAHPAGSTPQADSSRNKGRLQRELRCVGGRVRGQG